MDKYYIILPKVRGNFAVRLSELDMLVNDYLEKEQLDGRSLTYAKVFLSDAQNQYQQFIETDLYQQVLSRTALTVVEQPPLCSAKIGVLLMTSDRPADFIFQSMRLTEEETRGTNSYIQTMLLFDKYLKSIADKGLDIRTHLARTWIYVADIDVNYAGVVKARNDVFKRYGLTADTHYIASTGIGGYSQVRSACVAIDFITYPNLREEDKMYLQALDHLNPTHEYGVAFERGTRLAHDRQFTYFISGTASIDKHGDVLYVGDVERQTGRLLENIGALLADGGATMNDIQYFIIYLRDLSDYKQIDMMMSRLYPQIPHIIVEAKVCRPQWLIEMECVAKTFQAAI